MSVQTRIAAHQDHAASLLAWYDLHARSLPWRVPPHVPERPDPYHVWLSEIMLQQTTVAAVTPYFHDFIRRWPTLTHLARADDAEVMAAWAGLGYYARARNLLACARILLAEHGGNFPDQEDQLRQLPGIGPYTAAAIAAIAFDRQAGVVDGNVERVIARLFALKTPLPQVKKQISALARALTPTDRPGAYAQAMMDLGAMICTPRAPDCAACPRASACAAYKAGAALSYPIKATKPVRPEKYGTAFWITHKGHVFCVQRPPRGLLGGMIALPTSDWLEKAPPPLRDASIKARWQVIPAAVRHVFTHFALTLDIAMADMPDRPATLPPGQWVACDKIAAVGLPSLFLKVARVAINKQAKP